MKRLMLVLACLIAMATPAFAADVDADKMLADFEAQKAPAFDGSRRDDQEYVKSYIAQRNDYEQKVADFAKDFYAKYPSHPKAMELMRQRWQILASLGRGDDVIKETDQMLAANPDDAARADLLFARAAALMSGRDVSKAAPAVDEFIKAAPKDPRGASLLSRMAMRAQDPAESKKINQRIVDNYPNSPSAGYAKGQIHRSESVGKPFDLKFTDAISGKDISMADLKGKVVVVDFWATWCGPCVGEMPNMKKLYAQYKDKGVEFIGVSLDQPGDGLQKLKDFVAKNEITWPQYYQGKGWDSEFSSGWGINSIPCVFVIDAEGKLYSTDARGKLEKMIPTLLGASARAQG